MSRFIDREYELSALEKEYAADRASFVVLYGRRRIGKTTLISEFIRNKNALYFLASEESEQQNLNMFKNLAADYINSSLLRNATVERWDDVFEAIMEKPSEEKRVIVIDEFQYLGKANAAFPSVFQRIWDTRLKEQRVMVILCGSLITMMESQTLDHASPLYGRRTAQLKMRQIPFRYYQEFFPSRSRRELVERYSVTGGVPKYIELFEDQEDIFSAIEENVLRSAGFLYEEPTFLLQHEVSEVGSYFSIIKAIAAGNQKPQKIATVLEVKQTSLPKYLKTLMDMDILEREVPITEQNPEKSKKCLYKVKDHFMEFWFRFVYPNKSYLEMGDAAFVMRRLKENFIDNHVAFVYEDICRQEVYRLCASGALPLAFEKTGRWWDSAGNEIDVVATDSGGRNILFGECKFWEKPVGVNILHELEKKAALVDWNRNDRHELFALFSISGFTDELQRLAGKRNDLFLFD